MEMQPTMGNKVLHLVISQPQGPTTAASHLLLFTYPLVISGP